jgi:hypothetical protein
MKNNTVLALVIALIALVALGSAGIAYAQTAEPSKEEIPYAGYGMMRGGRWGGASATGAGLLHDYLNEALASQLNLTPEVLQARIDTGETHYEVALSQGLNSEQISQLFAVARTEAFAEAVADGVITPEKADWMGQFAGQGTCDGSGVPLRQGGVGMRGAWNH